MKLKTRARPVRKAQLKSTIFICLKQHFTVCTGYYREKDKTRL